jgi:hypothetical protein
MSSIAPCCLLSLLQSRNRAHIHVRPSMPPPPSASQVPRSAKRGFAAEKKRERSDACL